MRDKGDGSIFWNARRERFIGLISVTGPDGKRRRLTVSGKTKAEVKGELVRRQKTASTSGVASGEMTVSDYILLHWLPKATIEQSTRYYYETAAQDYIIPIIGAVPLRDVEPRHVTHLLDMLSRKSTDNPPGWGKSTATVKRAYVTLRRALNYAASKQGNFLIPLVATDRVDCPAHKSKKVKPYSVEEVRKLRGHLADKKTWIGSLVTFDLLTGMRQGELLGLPWSAVNLAKGEIHIGQQLVEVYRKGDDGKRELVFFGIKNKTKTGDENKDRIIGIGPEAVKALRAQKARLMEAGLAACPWVFPQCNGEWYKKRELAHVYTRLLRKAGLRRIRWHDLRHTFATLTMESNPGEDAIKYVSETLGHSSTDITRTLYQHSSTNAQRRVLTNLEEALK